ncbi:syntaxin of plants SYP6 [Fistulifera solaris]|uniref:Syntaxin of plants SYP6 n=1 Tax=Fistulifera solaris TaxID=1519565 RepID=A0A1Z5JPK3_FISSO|nr:syntaxin of plants SYP6 [Fistulifera solaris]|eukprot:GAX15688.1 syntaxin of plants SYP6 [Fistulifera solaris]
MSYESLNGNNCKSNFDSSSFRPSTLRSAAASVASGASFRMRSQDHLSEPLTAGMNHDESPEDPYFVFRADLMQQLELVDEALAEFLRVVHQTDTSVNTYEMKSSKKTLKRHLKHAEATLKDVQMTVQLVDNDRDKFPHIHDAELYERRTLCETSAGRIHRAKQESASEAVKAKLLQDERAKAVRRAGDLGATNAAQRENTTRILDSQARTSLLMQHQDETLDELDAAVTRVGRMADGIHDEIGQQHKMLTEMESDLDEAEQQLGLVMGKLSKFLQTKNNGELYTIMVLFGIMLLLLLLVVYT